MQTAHPVIAEVVRSGFVESVHRGSIVVLDSSGEFSFRTGDVDVPMFPRSSNKPAQAVAMVRMGLALRDEQLALATASHSGEPFHVDGARGILASVGLAESALQNTPQWPLDETARLTHIREGGDKSSVAANCSGKHAAMLATCVAAGWPTKNYLDPIHPLQEGIRHTVSELAGEPITHAGVDGCGAPLFGLSLIGLARSFRALSLAEPDSPEGHVAGAIRDFPEWVSGTSRTEARLIKAVAGLIAKTGAEGVHAAGLADGSAIAFKIDDGAERARPFVMQAALNKLGIETPEPVHDDDDRTPSIQATL